METTGVIFNTQGTTTIVKLSAEEFIFLGGLQSHWDDLVILYKSGVFDFKNGHTEIHRDADGTIREISTKIKRFRS